MTDRKSGDEASSIFTHDSPQSAADGSSPLTVLDDFSTVGFISDSAEHWAIEPFVPIDNLDVQSMLARIAAADNESIPPLDWNPLRHAIDSHLDTWAGMRCRRVTAAYRDRDPDRLGEHLPLLGPATDESQTDTDDRITEMETPADPTMAEIEQLATAAGYTPVDRSQIEQCVGVASHWGVPLHIDFSAFERLHVYARGDVVGYRVRRTFQSFYLRRIVRVPVYRRMVVAFEMKSDRRFSEASPDTEVKSSDKLPHAPNPCCIHLRMFKNIPKQDVDMLLPTARVKISGMDRLKIVLPSLGGFLMALRKIAQFTLLLAALALHWAAILVAIAIGYLVKTTFSYFQTRSRYQLNLTKNLYFQKVAAGEAVLAALVQQAVAQRRAEATLAYYSLATADEPISTRRLKRRCQRYVRNGLSIEIDFQVDRALSLLVDTGLATREPRGWVLVNKTGIPQQLF